METLDRLCRTLDCQIGDLFVYEAGAFQPLQPAD
jgi:DNA-binding Xre family transcriptional regulator